MAERDLLSVILTELKDEYLHMVYVAAKTLHDIQMTKGADQ